MSVNRENKKHWELDSFNPFPKKDLLTDSCLSSRGSIREYEGTYNGEEEYKTFLEIGLDKEIDHRLFALCVLVDDLDDLLGYIKKYPYPINVLVEAFLSKWASLKKEVDKSVKDDAEYRNSDEYKKHQVEVDSILDDLKPGVDLVKLQDAFDNIGDEDQ
jgi:hypothetical protein